jgi:ADP-ribose pyrophosphatase YjhB (NUDIX family)
MSRQLEVHVGVICFKKDKVLILKRTPERRMYPKKWECGGGRVRPGESFQDACKRQMVEEASIDIEYVDFVGIYEIPIDDNYKIPGAKFACKIVGYKNGKKPEISEEHTEYKFISEDEIDNYDFIEGIQKDIRKAYEAMRKNKEIK